MSLYAVYVSVHEPSRSELALRLAYNCARVARFGPRLSLDSLGKVACMPAQKLSSGADAVVTGAGNGIGRAFALELARRGGRVVCSDLDLGAAQVSVDAIARAGGVATALACDVSRLEDVQVLAERAQQWFGRSPTLVVNNAGVGAGGQWLEKVPLDEWRWIMGVNLWGVVHGCHVFVPLLRAAGRGAVLNVASAASFGAAPLMGPYNASKAAVLAISETLHAELAGTGVHVAVLCPTLVKTDIVRSAKLGGSQRIRAQRAMDRTGMAPDVLVTRALDAMDRGQIHLLPQLDAQLGWMFKRLAPGLFTRGMGYALRLLPNHD